MRERLPWKAEIEPDSDYLDGITCRMMVKNEAGLVIAYAFDEDNTKLMSAAPDMLACLIEIRALITEAGLTGFNCHEGDWAERLFATQAASHAAVRKATGA